MAMVDWDVVKATTEVSWDVKRMAMATWAFIVLSVGC